jgi:hypothetical protein
MPFQLLGPYTVTHSDVDPVSWFDLGAIADSTLVFSVAVFVREAFTSSNEKLSVALGETDGSAQTVLAFVDATGVNANAAPTSDMAARVASDHDFNPLGIPRATGMAQNGAHLVVSDSVGSNSAGSADIYLLATVPA